MKGTYSQIFVHIIFSVKKRENLIPENNLDEVFDYIAGVIRNKGQKPIIVGGVSNHIHAFIGLKPDVSVSSIARDIKNNSSKFINQKKWVTGKFNWQNGFGAFTYGNSQVGQVVNYIKNQAEHHKLSSFREEFAGFLERFNVEFEEKNLADIEF